MNQTQKLDLIGRVVKAKYSKDREHLKTRRQQLADDVWHATQPVPPTDDKEWVHYCKKYALIKAGFIEGYSRHDDDELLSSDVVMTKARPARHEMRYSPTIKLPDELKPHARGLVADINKLIAAEETLKDDLTTLLAAMSRRMLIAVPWSGA